MTAQYKRWSTGYTINSWSGGTNTKCTIKIGYLKYSYYEKVQQENCIKGPIPDFSENPKSDDKKRAEY